MTRAAIATRILALIMLLIFWGLYVSPLSGVVFILALAALSIIRYRFGPYRWLMAAETALCVVYGLFWSPALLGLWLIVIGFLEERWRREESEILHAADADRAQLLRLEGRRAALEREIIEAESETEIAERARIAQEIHDNVGHEIAGALLALQAVERLWDAGSDEDARTLLGQATERVAEASEHLRETVHNLRPDRAVGVEELREICLRFNFCPAHFAASGDLSRVTSSSWRILSSVLKEALTNVWRHSQATAVTVSLDANLSNVRLAVRDNGDAYQEAAGRVVSQGLGISGMESRARAAGGSLVVSGGDGFTVTCILPLMEDRE